MEPDLTSEGLVRALQNNDERVIVLDPEGSGVLDSTTGRRYKKSGDHTAGSLSVILKCWSGEPIRQTRAKNADFSHASFRPRPGRRMILDRDIGVALAEFLPREGHPQPADSRKPSRARNPGRPRRLGQTLLRTWPKSEPS